MENGQKKGLIMKLDLENAYDMLNWNFLLQHDANDGFPKETDAMD